MTTLRRQDTMTTFKERERGFEKKFALDQEQEFKATARRNRALPGRRADGGWSPLRSMSTPRRW